MVIENFDKTRVKFLVEIKREIFRFNSLDTTLKARLHRRFLSPKLNATQCNFCRAEFANSCDFIAILLQFVNVNVSTRLLLKQKLCACKKVKLLLKVTVPVVDKPTRVYGTSATLIDNIFTNKTVLLAEILLPI